MKRKKSRNLKPRLLLPPGPWKLPIIGNMHHLIGIGVIPIHHKLRNLAVKYGPVMHLKLGEVDHIVISSPEAAREVTKTHDLNFASRPELAASKILLYDGTDIVFAPYGDYWRQLRKLCTLEVLSVRRVRSFSHIREEEISDVAEQISVADGNPINLTAMLVSLTNSISCRAISSCKDDMYRKKFVSALEDAVNLASGFAITDLFPSFGFIDVVLGVKRRLERARLKFGEVMDEIIKEHQQRKYYAEEDESAGGVEDLVDVLLRIKDDDQQLQVPLTVDNIKAVIFDMFSAGTETTSTTLTWAMAELVKNPKVMKKVQMEVRQILKGKAKIHEDDICDLQYLKLVIKETLRLHPPLPLLLPRACGETCEVGGFTIPSGARVMINVWALGRDPGVWDDAETFQPERFDGISSSSLQILALRFWQKNMPRDHIWAHYSRARASKAPLPLQLGASRWNETRRSGHDRYVWGYCEENARFVSACKVSACMVIHKVSTMRVINLGLNLSTASCSLCLVANKGKGNKDFDIVSLAM